MQRSLEDVHLTGQAAIRAASRPKERMKEQLRGSVADDILKIILPLGHLRLCSYFMHRSLFFRIFYELHVYCIM